MHLLLCSMHTPPCSVHPPLCSVHPPTVLHAHPTILCTPTLCSVHPPTVFRAHPTMLCAHPTATKGCPVLGGQEENAAPKSRERLAGFYCFCTNYGRSEVV